MSRFHIDVLRFNFQHGLFFIAISSIRAQSLNFLMSDLRQDLKGGLMEYFLERIAPFMRALVHEPK